MINCDEFHKFIDDYVYDEVSFFVKAQMDEHIASCPKCREEAEFLKEIKSTLYAMPRLEVDESFKAALNEKLDAAEKTVDRKRRRSFFRDWRTYSALAACLVLAFVVQSKVGDFYRHSTVDPAQIPAENVADIDLSEMQKTTDQDESYTVPQNAAVNEQKEAAAEAPQETNQKNTVRSAAKQTEKPVVTQKPERQEEKTTDAPKPTAAQPVKPKATVITEDQAVQDTVQSSAVAEGAENPTLADTGENGTVIKAAASPSAAIMQQQAEEDTSVSYDGMSRTGGSGGESVASGGGSAKTFSASVGGTVSVDAENVSKAKQIADKYGTVNGNSVEMTKKEFQNYLNTLEKNDIQYSHDVPDSELVDVEIVAN